MRLFALMIAGLLLIGCNEKPAEKPVAAQSAEVKDLVSAIYAGSLPKAAEAIARGADVNGRCKLGWTPLMHAGFSGNLEMVKLLVEKGATVDKEAIDRAEDRGNAEVVAYLKARQP